MRGPSRSGRSGWGEAKGQTEGVRSAGPLATRARHRRYSTSLIAPPGIAARPRGPRRWRPARHNGAHHPRRPVTRTAAVSGRCAIPPMPPRHAAQRRTKARHGTGTTSLGFSGPGSPPTSQSPSPSCLSPMSIGERRRIRAADRRNGRRGMAGPPPRPESRHAASLSRRVMGPVPRAAFSKAGHMPAPARGVGSEDRPCADGAVHTGGRSRARPYCRASARRMTSLGSTRWSASSAASAMASSTPFTVPLNRFLPAG